MKLKDLLNENVLGALPSSKLMKMKWNPVTEASAEKGLKTIPAVLSWDIEQFLKKQKDARKLTKGSFTDLVQALHSRGFEDRLNGANLRNWQAVVKKHIKESVNITEGDNTQYSWGQINKALMKYGMSPRHIGDLLLILKKI